MPSARYWGLGVAAIVGVGLLTGCAGWREGAEDATARMNDALTAQLAAHVDERGNVVVEVPTCFVRKIMQLTLTISDDVQPAWKLVAADEAGVAPAPVTLGTAPEGYRQSRALGGALPEDANVRVKVSGHLHVGDGPLAAEADFTVEQLRSRPIAGACDLSTRS